MSQVYAGAGGSAVSEPYNNDFVELRNLTGSAINLAGWAVQYATATGTTWQTTPLTGSIPANGYYLIQEASDPTPTGAALPTPQATGTIAMSFLAGKVALTNSTTALTGSGCPATSGVVDLVGWGTAGCFEGSAAAPATSATTAALRGNNGCIDTDDNSADFSAGTPAARNANTAQVGCATPVLAPIGNRAAAEGSQLQFAVSGTDADPNDTLNYSASNLPTGATFDPATRTFTWTPGFAQAGTYPGVHFMVSDGVHTDSKDITITVANTNRAPVLGTIEDKTVAEGSQLQFTLSATDPDGDTLTYSASNLPTGATFDPATRTFTWTPGSTQAGSYPAVHFAVSDGTATDFKEITITATDTEGGGDGGDSTSAATMTTIRATAKGRHVKVAGTVLPAQSHGQAQLTLMRSKRKGAPMKAIRSATATLDAAGAFAATLKRKPKGRCQVRAEWPGDADSLPSSATDSFKC
jgi:hypothetical protein